MTTTWLDRSASLPQWSR